MSFTQELTSWLSPSKPATEVASPPELGAKAPSSEKLKFNGKPTVITFLRHCGCPCESYNPSLTCPKYIVCVDARKVAESTFKDLRATAAKNPNVRFVAISHSDESSTEKWLQGVGGPIEIPDASTTAHSDLGKDAPSSSSNQNAVETIVDSERDIYSRWGLGTSSWGHVLSPSGLYAVYQIGKEKGIYNRPTESGNRWQTAGSWAVDDKGNVKWGKPSDRADEIPDFEEAVKNISS